MSILIEKLEKLQELLISIEKDLKMNCNENYDMWNKEQSLQDKEDYYSRFRKQIKQMRNDTEVMKKSIMLFNQQKRKN